MLADEVAGYLAGQGLGLTLGSSAANGVFAVPFPPEANDTATAIIEYGGEPPLDAFGPSLSAPVFERPRFQVCCRDRSDNTATCRGLIQSIYKKLRHFSGTMPIAFDPNSTVYGFVQALSPPAFLKFDENQRVYYVVSFSARKVESM